MANDVVFLIDIGLDQCDFRNAPIAHNQIENRHAAAAGADLHDVSHARSFGVRWIDTAFFCFLLSFQFLLPQRKEKKKNKSGVEPPHSKVTSLPAAAIHP